MRNSKHTYSKSHDASGQKTGTDTPRISVLVLFDVTSCFFARRLHKLLRHNIERLVLETRCCPTKQRARYVSFLWELYRYSLLVSVISLITLAYVESKGWLKLIRCVPTRRENGFTVTAWTGLSVFGKLMKVNFSWKHQSESASKCFMICLPFANGCNTAACSSWY